MSNLTDEERLKVAENTGYNRGYQDGKLDGGYEERQVAKEIFRAYDTYVKALEEENGSLASLAHIHGWRSSQVDFGKECRSKIKSLKANYLSKP